MARFEVPEVDYTRYTNRQLAAVPLAVLVVALAVLGGWFAITGTPVTLGTEFTGGTELTIETTSSQSEIASAFDQEPASIQRVASTENRYILTFGPGMDDDALREQANTNLEPTGGDEDVVASFSSVSASFGAESRNIALIGIAIAFAGMSALAFLLFRTFVPSIAIVISAFSDIMIPLAVMNLTALIPLFPTIKLSLGTVAALLMLIGYSVDSDILLNNHILRRSGEFYDSTHRAMRTGVTMTVTSISAMTVMSIVAFVFGIDLLAEIGIVLVVGLTADLMNTYLLNLSLLRWYKFEGVTR